MLAGLASRVLAWLAGVAPPVVIMTSAPLVLPHTMFGALPCFFFVGGYFVQIMHEFVLGARSEVAVRQAHRWLMVYIL